MDWNLKKMWPAAAASLVAFTSILNAAVDDAQVRNIENRVCNLEKACPTGCINPDARPQVQCGYNLFVEAELLWWSVYEYGLDYAMKSRHTDTPTSLINKGETVGPGNNYSWAFRFGVGYNLPHDGWDLRANWTFFNNEVTDHARAPHVGGLFPIWGTPDFGGVLDDLVLDNISVAKANCKWDVELNIIDLELGREFFTSKYLTLRPHMGFRYVRLDQTYHVTYDQPINAQNWEYLGADPRQSKDLIRNSNDFWGFGLRGGFDTQWGISNGFSIYGNFALALLHGHFHISQEEYIRSKNDRSRINRMDFNNRKRVGRATTDLALGLRWDHMFEGDRFHLGLQLGWEHHMFFGQNQMWQMANTFQPAVHAKGNDELTTQGWTFAARFDF